MAVIMNIAEDMRSDEELLKAYQLEYKQDLIAILYLRYTELVYGVCMNYFKE